MNRNNTTVFPCDKIRYAPVDKHNCLDQGICLVVPVSIHGVCANSHLLVIVEVYQEKQLYSRKIKKIYTGDKKDCKPNCCEENKIIDCLFIDNFKFYFINECSPKCIHVEVSTQYIYDCE